MRSLEHAEAALETEHAKSEALLRNILPDEIAASLKDHNQVIADSFEGASVLFADVVNFTPLSATMKPAQVVEILDEVFSGFDVLVEKYGLEKIKTIGDCYMVAAGVPCPRQDHAQVLARLALEMRDYVAQHQFQGHTLHFRIGLNSGPLVAGVIGRRKFIYAYGVIQSIRPAAWNHMASQTASKLRVPLISSSATVSYASRKAQLRLKEKGRWRSGTC